MKQATQSKQYEKINAFLIFFVIVSCQIGVGIHGFQRVIYEEAKQDAWISVVLSFILAHIVVFIMFKTLEKFDGLDIYGIQKEVFGKILGKFLNLLYVIYCTFAFFAVLKNYIEVVNTWVFPYVNARFIAIAILLIVIYAVTGGLRVIVGISFFSFFFLLWIPPVLIFPLYYSNPNFLLPIMEDWAGILRGVYLMSFTIVGFEILNIIYPYIKEKERKNANKYAQIGLLATFFLYITIMLITIMYFSGPQLERVIWATLTIFNIIEFPFVERIEIITICLWLLIVLPNLCLYLWAAYRGVSSIFKIELKKFIWIFASIIFIFTFIIRSRTEINTMNNYFGQISFYVVFVYPFLLYLFASIKKRRRKGTGDSS
ncbi:GerAB/ArcD/ProY family transporter [Ureibacillus acetophenoni]|uniref:Spore germination protein (Amino acid permease) n=1 Tax=Ureibacillus acetophenoni TaxID=614649 RepID=A0A285U9V9_9BACL|nr:GerAB/ArcD/ProY family transporter [Ureibacillus acetophenoni]SOC37346.1 spore germination protein (amino acid permease) [Ureibacillus acetophenoni]